MMYALLTDTNDFIRIQSFEGGAPSLAPEKGLRWVPYVEVRPTALDGQVDDGYAEALEAGEWVRRYNIRDTTYAERRTTGTPRYASLPEQLDMQYRDAVNGTTTWRDHIAAVKAAHPKPVA